MFVLYFPDIDYAELFKGTTARTVVDAPLGLDFTYDIDNVPVEIIKDVLNLIPL